MNSKKIILLCLALLLTLPLFSFGDEIVDKIMRLRRRAVGGVDAMLGFITSRLEYDLTIDGQPGSKFIVWYGENGGYREIIETAGRRSSMSYDGDSAYLINPANGKVLSYHSPDGRPEDLYYLNLVRSSALLFPLLNADRFGIEVTLKNQTDDLYVVNLQYPDGTIRELTLNLLMRITGDVTRVNRSGITLVIEKEYDNYAEYSGAFLPTHTMVQIDGTVLLGGKELTLKREMMLTLKKAERKITFADSQFVPGIPDLPFDREIRKTENVSFMYAGSIPVGNAPKSAVISDIDADGKVDLIVADEDNVSILEGDGEGKFPRSWSINGTTGMNSAILVEDLNNDSKSDLVITSSAMVAEKALLALTGNNVFTVTPLSESFKSAPSTVVSGFFNSDKTKDLAIAYPDEKKIDFFSGNSLGGFVSSWQQDTQIQPRKLAAAKINGDEIDDLLVADGNSVRIFISNDENRFDYVTLTGAGDKPSSIAFHDIDQDGHLDAIIGNDVLVRGKYDKGIVVYFGDGEGNFPQAKAFAALTGITDFAIADFNLDGKLDLVSCSYDNHNITVYLNNEGVLSEELRLSCGWGPVQVLAADINKDGISDIITINKNSDDCCVWLGQAKSK